MPRASIVVMSAEPPGGHERQRHPDDREQADDGTDVDHRLAEDPRHGARGRDPDEVVLERRPAVAGGGETAKSSRGPRGCRAGRVPRR
jgi:hypothetical protein